MARDGGAAGESEETGEAAYVEDEVAVEQTLCDVAETRADGGEDAQVWAVQVACDLVKEFNGEGHGSQWVSLYTCRAFIGLQYMAV